MNKKLFSIFVLTLCFIGNMWVSAQNRLTAGESVGAGDFYLYNVGANRFLNNGSQWNTHAALDGSGLQATFTQSGDKYYIETHVVSNSGLHHLFLVDGNIYTDGAQKEFKFERVYPAGYTNAYIISCTDDNNNTFYLGWAGGGSGEAANNVIISSNVPSTEDFLWLLISPNNRGIDYTSVIQNPDFERYYNWPTDPNERNINVSDWQRGDFWLQRTSQTFANAVFAEKWTWPGPFNSYDKCSQTIYNLPAGTYTLTVTAQAIDQNNNNAACTQGVNLYLGNSKTLIGAAGTYSVTTTHNGGDLELGVEIESGNNANWVAFDNVRLYKSDLAFSANSATVPNGTTSYNDIILLGATGSVYYSTECYGNITSATVNSNGQITNISYKANEDQGGAVVVHASCNGNTVTYVLTVAYRQNLWDFTLTYDLTNPDLEHGKPREPANILDTYLKPNNTDWAMTYKVRTYTDHVLTYLNAPVISNATRVDGNNADYNQLTAGLLITADAKSFGSNTVLPSEFYDANGIKTDKLNDALNLDANSLSSNGSRAEILTLYNGSELTIPYLKAGDYVRMKWKAYDNDKGDKIELTNLTDLEGKDMEYIYASSIRDGGSNHGEGYHVFKVKESKDVKFRVGDSGWLNIYSIQVTDPSVGTIDGYTTFKDDHSYNDKINLYSMAMDTNLSKPKTGAPIEYISGQTANWANTGGSVRCQQNVAIEYGLEGLDGGSISSTLAGTEISETGELSVKGHGQCVVVSKGFTVLAHIADGQGATVYDPQYVRYYVDLERTLITVNEKGTVEQDYPYTWNFTDLSDDTKNKLNADQTNWSNNNGTFTPTDAYQKAFVTGSGISYVNSNSNNKKIKEYEGFGINTHVDKGYSTDLKKISVTSDGLVVGESTSQSSSPTFTIPAVPSTQTVYIRYSGNGSVTLTNGEGTIVSDFNEVNGDKVCNVVGTGSKNDNTAGDVTITASNVTIKAIGVTGLKKEGRFKSTADGLYYNSECQSYDINYDYTEDFTGTKMGAYLVVLADAETNTVTTEDIKIVPATIGSIIYTTDEQVEHHIFVPSVNQAVTEQQKDDAIHSSILTGVIVPTDLPASNSSTNYYVFTNIWGYVKGNDKSDTNSQTASIPGFFRVNSAGTLNAHRAYLAVAVSGSGNSTSPVKAYTLFPWNGDFVDAIEAVPTTETESNIDMNGTFYTLQGTKIEGMPKQGGIYIQNGKKIFVK